VKKVELQTNVPQGLKSLCEYLIYTGQI
jgi:hypothetical protein